MPILCRLEDMWSTQYISNSNATALGEQLKNLYFWRGGGNSETTIKRVTCSYVYAEFFVFDDEGNVGIICAMDGSIKFVPLKNSNDYPISVKYIENKVFEITTKIWSNMSILSGNGFTVVLK